LIRVVRRYFRCSGIGARCVFINAVLTESKAVLFWREFGRDEEEQILMGITAR